MKVYQRIATLAKAIDNCEENGNWEWHDTHTAALEDIMANAPSGSGFDSGTKINGNMDYGKAGEMLSFVTSFHHMNDGGCYDGWTEHTVNVKPHLQFGFVVSSISGPNRNGIKEYMDEVFCNWLDSDIE